MQFVIGVNDGALSYVAAIDASLIRDRCCSVTIKHSSANVRFAASSKIKVALATSSFSRRAVSHLD